MDIQNGIAHFNRLINDSNDSSRHADDETVYLHSGNSVTQLNEYSKDFQGLVKRNPKLAKDFIKRAQKILKNAASVK